MPLVPTSSALSSRDSFIVDLSDVREVRDANLGVKSTTGGAVVSFQDLSYIVKHSTKKEEIHLLRGVSGFLMPGQLCALMGPSGCGKTTLLDVLAGRKTVGRQEGSILFGNAKPTRAFLQSRTGYVEQQESLLSLLTVAEMLMYTAELKRPLQESTADKRAAVEEVLARLALTDCCDTRIGCALRRGISGGQAKRVNIGLALITRPLVLFLDEPTSSLDSYTSNEVMTSIKLLVKDGITVCTTIHSPTAYSFMQFDRLLLLLRGRTIYFGDTGTSVVTYFLSPQVPTVEGAMLADGNNMAEWIVHLTTKADRLGQTAEFADAFIGSSECEAAMLALDGLLAEVAAGSKAGRSPSFKRAGQSPMFRGDGAVVVPAWWSAWVMFKYRTMRNFCDPGWLSPRVFQLILVSAVIMAIFWGTGSVNAPDQYLVTASVLYVFLMFSMFGAASYTPALVVERPLFIKEQHDGLYSPSVYLAAKLFGELSAAVMTTAVVCCCLWLALDLNGSFVLFWLGDTLMLATGIVLAYLVAALSPSMDVANSALLTTGTTLSMCAGYYIPVPNIPVWLRWYSVPNPLRYAWGVIMYNQFSGGCCDAPVVGGQPILQYYDLDGINPWAWLGIQGGITVVLAVCTLLALTFVRHEKR